MNEPAGLGRQRGAVSTLIAVVLLFATTLLAFFAARTTLMEQKITNNEYRAREVREAAEAGVEYVVAWLASNDAGWPALSPPSPPSGAGCPSGSAPQTATLAVPSITAAGGNVYNVNVSLTRNIDYGCTNLNYMADYVLITSQATSTSDSNITATVTQYVDQKHPTGNTNMPPLFIQGCLGNGVIQGNVSVYSYNGSPTVNTSGGAACADPNIHHLSCNSKDCTIGSDITQLSAADYFQNATGMTLEDFQAVATSTTAANAAAAAAQNPYLVVTDGHAVNDSLGSAARPVILDLQGCGGLNGNVTIYGWIYFPSSCSTPGLGNVTIYGSVIFGGSITKISGNPVIYEWSCSSISGSSCNNPPFPPMYAPKMLGTWKDF